MAGRPRKSAALLMMSGTMQKHPSRYEDRGPEPETKGPIGNPPEEFLRPGSGEAEKLAALWYKITDEAPIGLLTYSDREFVANMCRVGLDAKRDGRNRDRARTEYAKMLKTIGMTPEGRAQRGLGGKAPTKTANPLEEFRQKRRRAI